MSSVSIYINHVWPREKSRFYIIFLSLLRASETSIVPHHFPKIFPHASYKKFLFLVAYGYTSDRTDIVNIYIYSFPYKSIFQKLSERIDYSSIGTGLLRSSPVNSSSFLWQFSSILSFICSIFRCNTYTSSSSCQMNSLFLSDNSFMTRASSFFWWIHHCKIAIPSQIAKCSCTESLQAFLLLPPSWALSSLEPPVLGLWLPQELDKEISSAKFLCTLMIFSSMQ